MKVAVLGSGNGGHAVAFEWAQAGHQVYMYDFDQFPENIAKISKAGGITSDGQLEGFQKVEYAGHDIEKVVKGAELIFAVGPAYSTGPFGEACKPHVEKGQIYVICPGSSLGSVEFKRALGLELNDDSVVVSEMGTLPYAVRITGEAKISVYNRLPGGVLLASLPKKENDRVYDIIKPVHICTEKAASVMQTALQNANPLLHPVITTLNVSRIENTDLLFYEQGVTPGVGHLLKAMDEERIAMGKKLGFTILPDPVIGMRQGYMAEESYDVGYSKAPGFKGIMAPNTLDYRFYNEDAGYGMVLWLDMADRMGMEVPIMRSLLTIISAIMQRDYAAEKGRTLEKLGFGSMTMDEINAML